MHIRTWINTYMHTLISKYLHLISPVGSSLHVYLIFFPQQLFQSISPSSFSAPGSRQLVCIAYYLVLSFFLMYSSNGLSTDVFS